MFQLYQIKGNHKKPFSKSCCIQCDLCALGALAQGPWQDPETEPIPRGCQGLPADGWYLEDIGRFIFRKNFAACLFHMQGSLFPNRWPQHSRVARVSKVRF